MKRIVYSPKVYVYVQTVDRGIIDLSDYVINGSVTRILNGVSSAEFTLRNPKIDAKHRLFTQAGEPLLHPMDPITVYASRVNDWRVGHSNYLKPVKVQLFTGYLDRSPWFQMYPGTCTIAASCTIKKIQHTYWDPALPFTREFMKKYGWVQEQDGSIANLAMKNKTLTSNDGILIDGSIGKLLHAILRHVGHWRDDRLWIQKLPSNLVSDMAQYYLEVVESNKELTKAYQALLEAMIGTVSYGSGGDSNPVDPNADWVGTGSWMEIGGTWYGPPLDPAKSAFGLNLDEELSYAELGTAVGNTATGEGYIAQLFDSKGIDYPKEPGSNELQRNYPLEIRKKGGNKSIIAFKRDRGYGQGDSYYAVDLWVNAAKALDLDTTPGAGFKGALEIRRCVPKKDKSDPDDTGDPNDKRAPDQQDSDSPGRAKASVSSVEEQTAKAASPAENQKPTQTGDQNNTDQPDEKIYAPVPQAISIGDGWGAPRTNADGSPREHHGVDVRAPDGSPCIAPVRGKIVFYTFSGFGAVGGMMHLQILDEDNPANLKKGTIIGWGHVTGKPDNIVKGKVVEGGTTIAYVGMEHVHFIYQDPPASPGVWDGNNSKVEEIIKRLQKGEKVSDSGGSSTGGSGATLDINDMMSVAKASAFAVEFNWPTAVETLEAVALRGKKSLMNDKPLLPFIQQLCQGSMRSFQSLPNGAFMAFYPDYFGNYNTEPYWYIRNDEILDGRIDLTDEGMATHVYVVGDTMPYIDSSAFDRLRTGGVVDILTAAETGLIKDAQKYLAPNKKSKKKGKTSDADNARAAIDFLQRYGARPYLEEAPFVRSPFFEAFLALQTFQLMWSRQFLTDFQFTFMPELYPGGAVAFPDQGVRCFIDSVTHTFDYSSGFTTQAQLSAPAPYTGDHGTRAHDKISTGMIYPIIGNR